MAAFTVGGMKPRGVRFDDDQIFIFERYFPYDNRCL